MLDLTSGQVTALIGAVVLLLLRREGGRIFAALDRIPAVEWFTRVEAHMVRGHEHSNILQAHTMLHANHKESFEKGRARMNALDGHLEATDKRVDQHETRISVLEAK